MAINNKYASETLIVQGIDVIGASSVHFDRQPGVLKIGGKQILTERQAAISDGLTDAQKIAAILAAMRTHGLIES